MISWLRRTTAMALFIAGLIAGAIAAGFLLLSAFIDREIEGEDKM